MPDYVVQPQIWENLCDEIIFHTTTGREGVHEGESSCSVFVHFLLLVRLTGCCRPVKPSDTSSRVQDNRRRSDDEAIDSLLSRFRRKGQGDMLLSVESKARLAHTGVVSYSSRSKQEETEFYVSPQRRSLAFRVNSRSR